MRVCLVTDTLNDVNGVARFIRNVGQQARAAGRDLHLITSTRFPPPGSGPHAPPPNEPNVHNIAPLFARPMPGYPQLDFVIPPRARLLRLLQRLAPDAVHVSTPGSVGQVGRTYARRAGVPLLGTYHTDFPAYIDHLFQDAAATWLCSSVMRHFYRPFAKVFTRSDEYARSMNAVGINRERIVRLLPGIDTDTFNASYRDHSGDIWTRQPGMNPAAVKVLYVGRVSIEKNLPMLAKLWPAVQAELAALRVSNPATPHAQLVVIGDGPYRAPMELALRTTSDSPHPSAAFLGFRHGRELSTLYASADAFVFPSTTDTLGQVVMEAQSAGLPVLVTDQGGPSGVVDDQRTGFVLPVSGPDPLARWRSTLVRLITDRELRERMGQAGRVKIAPLGIRASFEHFWDVHRQAIDLRLSPVASTR